MKKLFHVTWWHLIECYDKLNGGLYCLCQGIKMLKRGPNILFSTNNLAVLSLHFIQKYYRTLAAKLSCSTKGWASTRRGNKGWREKNPLESIVWASKLQTRANFSLYIHGRFRYAHYFTCTPPICILHSHLINICTYKSNISDVGQNYYNCVLHRIPTQWW